MQSYQWGWADTPSARNDADAAQAATETETRRRLREARRDQREREDRASVIAADIDARVREAVSRERQTMIDIICDAVGEGIGELMESRLRPITDKLAELERLLNRLSSRRQSRSRSTCRR